MIKFIKRILLLGVLSLSSLHAQEENAWKMDQDFETGDNFMAGKAMKSFNPSDVRGPLSPPKQMFPLVFYDLIGTFSGSNQLEQTSNNTAVLDRSYMYVLAAGIRSLSQNPKYFNEGFHKMTGGKSASTTINSMINGAMYIAVALSVYFYITHSMTHGHDDRELINMLARILFAAFLFVYVANGLPRFVMHVTDLASGQTPQLMAAKYEVIQNGGNFADAVKKIEEQNKSEGSSYFNFTTTNTLDKNQLNDTEKKILIDGLAEMEKGAIYMSAVVDNFQGITDDNVKAAPGTMDAIRKMLVNNMNRYITRCRNGVRVLGGDPQGLTFEQVFPKAEFGKEMDIYKKSFDEASKDITNRTIITQKFFNNIVKHHVTYAQNIAACPLVPGRSPVTSQNILEDLGLVGKPVNLQDSAQITLYTGQPRWQSPIDISKTAAGSNNYAVIEKAAPDLVVDTAQSKRLLENQNRNFYLAFSEITFIIWGLPLIVKFGALFLAAPKVAGLNNGVINATITSTMVAIIASLIIGFTLRLANNAAGQTVENSAVGVAVTDTTDKARGTSNTEYGKAITMSNEAMPWLIGSLLVGAAPMAAGMVKLGNAAGENATKNMNQAIQGGVGRTREDTGFGGQFGQAKRAAGGALDAFAESTPGKILAGTPQAQMASAAKKAVGRIYDSWSK